jgi:vacuole morphology and inheritance protein 14
MLLPQSSAFITLKNRLNAISAIGYAHSAPRLATSAAPSTSSFATPGEVGRPNRLKSRDDGPGAAIRWQDLFEKFRATQERQRKRAGGALVEFDRVDSRSTPPPVPDKERLGVRPSGGLGLPRQQAIPVAPQQVKERSRNPLAFGKFGGGGKKKK